MKAAMLKIRGKGPLQGFWLADGPQWGQDTQNEAQVAYILKCIWNKWFHWLKFGKKPNKMVANIFAWILRVKS